MAKTNPEGQQDPISPPTTKGGTPDLNIDSIKKRIKPIAEMAGPTSCLFYGRSGTGKTTLAGTFPKPSLLLDVSEKGTDSISDIEGIEVLKVECWEDFEAIYWYLRSGKHPYKTVIVDTVTQLQKLAINYILEQNGRDSSGPMNQNLWGQVAKLMSAWLTNYRDLEMHTVFLAQDRNSTEDSRAGEDQIIPEIGPRLSPSVAASVNAAVKIIGQTYIKEFVKATKDGQVKTYSFRLRIGPHSVYLTKVRKAKGIALPNSIHDPSFEKLMKAISPQPQAPPENPPETDQPQNTQAPK